MMNPLDFTPEEQMIVGYYRSHRAVSYFDVISLEATYWLAAGAMITAGAYFQSYALAAAALVVYGLFKLREILQQPQTMRTTASIIEKYEAKIAELRGAKPGSEVSSR